METWVLASGNAHKISEFNRFFSSERLGVELISMKEAGFEGTIDENGLSFAENAFLKADAVHAATGMTVLADDSGLCVDALGGRPGIYSARYAGEHGDDGANIEKLLSELEGIPEEKRTARFLCALCVVFADGSNLVTEGFAEGRILTEKRGSGDFGYDPVFFFPKRGKTFAEMTPEEKEGVSHRGDALRKLASALREDGLAGERIEPNQISNKNKEEDS